MSSYPEHPIEGASLPEIVVTRGNGPEPVVYPLDLDERRIDPDAAKVVRRLVRQGHEAYLVGGCVRDLLVGRSPKDFDVATSARPDDVRRLFKNSRVIGRRFRLVHVLFSGRKVIETATFRRAPEQEDSEADDILIRNDNVFGESYQDAARRDFTINGLFYDIERREVLDWVGGMPDIERRTVHTIGNPMVRFREDPVRILRAIKFCARLDFGMSAEVYDAIVACRTALARAAKPRFSRSSCGSCARARRTARSGSPGKRACSTCSCRSSRRTSRIYRRTTTPSGVCSTRSIAEPRSAASRSTRSCSSPCCSSSRCVRRAWARAIASRPPTASSKRSSIA